MVCHKSGKINLGLLRLCLKIENLIFQLAKSEGNVFATDAILATLMCCTRSVYSWDIIVQRVGKKLFFDKRDDSEFDLLTVSETATEPPQDDAGSINSPRNLALEATFINHNFSQQVLKMVGSITFVHLSRKTNNMVSEQVRHKLGCTSTEDG